MKTGLKNIIITVIGFCLLGFGAILVKFNSDPTGIMKALPYILIGLGAGFLGHGLGGLIYQKTLAKNKDALKTLEIEKNDERNVAIGNKAKAKAYDLMVILLGILMLTFVLLGVDMIAVLLLVGAYLIIIGYNSYNLYKYNKDM